MESSDDDEDTPSKYRGHVTAHSSRLGRQKRKAKVVDDEKSKALFEAAKKKMLEGKSTLSIKQVVKFIISHC